MGGRAKNGLFMVKMVQNGDFGGQNGGRKPKNGDFGAQIGGRHQNWPFLASKLGGAPNLGVWGPVGGGVEPKMGILGGKMPQNGAFLGSKWGEKA